MRDWRQDKEANVDEPNMPNQVEPHAMNLHRVIERLHEKATSTTARRASDTLYGSRETVLRQTLLVLLAGAELAAHDAPPEATLQVISGRVKLVTDEQSWTLEAGDLFAIPQERHSVKAIDDSAFVLTVRRA